jgi:hypothetical protein
VALARIAPYDAEAVYRSGGIAVFCNEVKGKSELALSRDLGLPYKSAFVLLHSGVKRWQRK